METIEFEGKPFPRVLVNMPFGEVRISTEILNETLMNYDGSYVSEEARLIDEDIFYFVEEQALRFSENKLIELILSEI
jgi:hypothetical protein